MFKYFDKKFSTPSQIPSIFQQEQRQNILLIHAQYEEHNKTIKGQNLGILNPPQTQEEQKKSLLLQKKIAHWIENLLLKVWFLKEPLSAL